MGCGGPQRCGPSPVEPRLEWRPGACDEYLPGFRLDTCSSAVRGVRVTRSAQDSWRLHGRWDRADGPGLGVRQPSEASAHTQANQLNNLSEIWLSMARRAPCRVRVKH
jgi:hypothetical protein